MGIRNSTLNTVPQEDNMGTKGRTITELTQAQEWLDYWLDRGGNITELENMIAKAIDDLLGEIKSDVGNTEQNIEIRIPTLDVWMRALQQAMTWTPKPSPPADHNRENLTAEFLLQDYELWVKEGGIANPLTYMDEFIEAHEQPPRQEVQNFLRDFFDEDIIQEWSSNIAWDEDEEQDPLDLLK
jgi:hypothetical protein